MVRLEGVTKMYGQEVAVNHVSLTVQKGEILVLIGPSGCGKTTILKMINGLIPYTSGNIFVNGTEITTTDPVKLRRKIGYVIQQIGLLPHLTIRDNISFVLQLTDVPKAQQDARARELIQLVGMPANYLDKRPRELSGGQQQRIGVARALAADPSLILMDEPFGAVDPITRQQLQEVMLELQRNLQKTIIFVTHDVPEAFKLGTRIAIMREGSIVKAGSVLEIIREEDQFVRQFLGRKAIFDVLENVTVLSVLDKAFPVFVLNEEGRIFDDTSSAYGMVVDDNQRFLGVVEKQRHNQGVVSTQDIQPYDSWIDPRESVSTGVERMLLHGRSWLPVLDNGKLLGAITFEACSRITRIQGEIA